MSAKTLTRIEIIKRAIKRALNELGLGVGSHFSECVTTLEFVAIQEAVAALSRIENRLQKRVGDDLSSGECNHDALEVLNALDDESRADLLGEFCVGCRRHNPKGDCTCWRDD